MSEPLTRVYFREGDEKAADWIKILAVDEIMAMRAASRQCHRYPPMMKLRSTPTAHGFGAARVTDADAA
ncbi:hypothetical protein BZM27_02600 [Paraburkholderia steynii]|uniref:Uncharacterized protein n=1 Tax=Paraburkholderia steynii TaxID=1245441 RepID=A0A4R0XSP9_9BURK|nr:hypothetical protein BZM27_02600 [Paraburkholderia steynii]